MIEKIRELDLKAVKLAESKSIDRLDEGLMALTGIGSVYFSLLLIAAVLRVGNTELASKILAGQGLVWGTSLAMKNRVKRDRPENELFPISELHSFPSGHAGTSFLLATVLSNSFPEFKIGLYSLASLIGFSRIYLRDHFPTDVIAGASLGVIVGTLVSSAGSLMIV